MASQGSRAGDDVQLGAIGGAKRVDVDVPSEEKFKIEREPNGTAPYARRTGSTCSVEHDRA